MATRGSPSRRMQGNPLGGILRDLDQRARTSGRTRKKPPADPVPGPRGPRGPAGQQGLPGGLTGAAAVIVTGDDGRARWEYPAVFAAAPVIIAVAVDPEGGSPVLAVLEEAEAAYAVLRVWWLQPRPASGLIEPAGAGVRVHVTACPVPE